MTGLLFSLNRYMPYMHLHHAVLIALVSPDGSRVDGEKTAKDVDDAADGAEDPLLVEQVMRDDRFWNGDEDQQDVGHG